MGICVVFFDQLLGAARTRKLVKLLFSSRVWPFLFIFHLFQFFVHFQMFFFLISGVKSLKKVKNEQKRSKTAENVFGPAFRCRQHPKAGRNTQQICTNIDKGIQKGRWWTTIGYFTKFSAFFTTFLHWIAGCNNSVRSLKTVSFRPACKGLDE